MVKFCDVTARRDPILGGWADGWDHQRDETGFCVNCGARAFIPHYALRPKGDDRIYRDLVRERVYQ